MKVEEKKRMEGKKEEGREEGNSKKDIWFMFTLFYPNSGPICTVYSRIVFSLVKFICVFELYFPLLLAV